MKSIEVVAAVICQGGKVFGTQRGYGDYAGGWEFPGGKVEPGESPEEALVREIREELDAAIAVDAYLCTVDYDYAAFHLTMHCYLAHLAENHLVLREHSAAKWLSAADIDSVDWLPADVEVVAAVKAAGVLAPSGQASGSTALDA